MPVITMQDAPVFDTGGAVITGLAAPSRGSKDVAAWRVAFGADKPSTAHSLTREEVFVVLTGSVTARFAGHSETATAGGALVVPAGAEFSLIAEDGPAEAICILPVGGQADTGSGAFTPPWAE
jgi:mannose-6-phosphate isomerase-like protein (cupin superfamily)